MGPTRVGWIGSLPRKVLPPSMTVLVYAPVDIAGVLAGAVDVWVVEGGLVHDRLREALFATALPVVVRASARGVVPWRVHQEAGRVDVIATSAPSEELFARIHAAARRANLFNALAARMATTVGHDLRSPLQGMRLVLMALERDGGMEPELAEDIDMLASAADSLEVMLHGLYNLGRKPTTEGGDVVDIVGLFAAAAGRRTFRGRVNMNATGPIHVRAHPAELGQAVLELLRVAVALLPSQRNVLLTVERAGDVARVHMEVPVWPMVLDAADALLHRDQPFLLRGKVRLPFAGLVFGRDVFRAWGGDLTLRAVPERELVVVDARVPAA